jgi:hypothetical protein
MKAHGTAAGPERRGSRAGNGRSDWRAPPEEEAGFWDVIRRVGFVALFPGLAEQLVAVARGSELVAFLCILLLVMLAWLAFTAFVVRAILRNIFRG